MMEAIIIAVAAVAVIAIIVVALVVVKKKEKKPKDKTADEVVVVDGVRYTQDESIKKNDGSARISHAQGDVIISKGETKTAKKEGELAPGRYTLLSANQNDEAFNLRIGGLVREYRHGDGIVLGENDEITAISHAVILR